MTLRVVRPFVVNGELLGYLELGKEVDYLTPYISDIFKSETLVALGKNNIEELDLKIFEKAHDKILGYKKTEKYFIINSTMASMPDNLKHEIDYNTQGVNTNLHLGGSDFSYFTIDLFDAKTSKVGNILMLIDLSGENKILDRSIYATTSIILVITILLLVFYYRHIKDTNLKLKKLNDEVVTLSITDELTGLYNKRYFNEMFEREIKHASMTNQYISLLIIDIDNFKKFNDNYGHLEGDKILSVVAREINRTLARKNDFCFRIGGEEFAILLSSCNENDTVKIAEKVVKNIYDLNISHNDNNSYGRVTVSIGIFSKTATNDLSMDEIYTVADECLYEAKNKGRNTFVA